MAFIFGTSGADSLSGTTQSDIITGLSGADTLRGLNGDDFLIGNAIPDTPEANDAAARDTLFGGLGDDQLIGQAGNDQQVGGSGIDLLYGGDGGDRLNGGSGSDLMFGGSNNDVFIVDTAGDVVYEATGGGGADLVRSNAADYTLNDAAGQNHIERLSINAAAGAAGATGNSIDNTMLGNADDNSLAGLDGDDILNGQDGSDSLVGGKGNDTFVVDTATDVAVEMEAEGEDLVRSAALDFTLGTWIENLRLDPNTGDLNASGNDQDNSLRGNSGANSLAGGSGADILDGAGGADVMAGGSGDDFFRVDDAGDSIVEGLNGGDDYAVISVSTYSLGENVETADIALGFGTNTLMAGDGSQSLNGRSGQDWMYGGSGDDVLSGGDGDDALFGGAGNDEVFGRAGIDSLFGGDGDDSLNGAVDADADQLYGGDGADVMALLPGDDAYGGSGDDLITVGATGFTAGQTIDGGEGSDTLLVWGGASMQVGVTVTGVESGIFAGTSAKDTITGTSIADTISGQDADDTLTGGAGDDTLDGGEGQDTAVFAGSLADYQVTVNSGSVTVHDGSGSDGTDLVSGVEVLEFADQSLDFDAPVRVMNGNQLLGTFSTIQAAVDASTAGDTIEVSAGSYGEVVTVDKQVTILGAQAGVDGADAGRGTGESSVDGGFLIQANGVILDGLRIEDGATIAGSKAGVYITGDDATITNMLFERSGGFDGYRGVLTPTNSDQSGLEVTASKFTGWATGVYTDADSDFEVTGNLFEANNVGMSADLPVLPGMVDGNTFTGNLFEDFGLGISASSFDLSALVGDANSFSGGVPEVSAYALNGGGSQTIEGSDANDVMQVAGASRVEFLGASGADTLTGGANSDVLDGGDGDDTAAGGAGQDSLSGGSGNDVLLGEGDDPLVSLPSYSTDFEGFDVGAVSNGDNGWVVQGVVDQEIVDLGGGHSKAFRISSDPSTVGGDIRGVYSMSAPLTAGEPQTTADVDSVRISYDFMAASNMPDSSRMEMDFGRDDHSERVNFLVIEWDDTVGLRIAVNEPTTTNGEWTTNDFTAFSGNRTLIEGLDGGGAQWHNLELALRFVDGSDNDVIDIYLDGALIGTTTTFENYWDWLNSDHAANAEADLTSRLFFRPSANGAAQDGPGGENQGFYFDNVKITAFNGGAAQGDSLEGGVGDDLLSGQLGDDTLSGGTGLDSLYGGEGDDTLTGGSGDDLMIGGVGLDQAVFAGSFADATLSTSSSGDLLVSGIDGNDTLNGVEDLAFADTTVRIVGEDGYATIQAAVDASTAGDTILVKAGSYGEVVTVDKQVTILGAQAGVDGADVGRGTGESSVDGGFLIQANGVVLDGLRIEDGATIAGSKAGVYITGDDATITNMLFERSGGFDGYRGVLTPTSSDQSGLEVTASKFTGWATGVYTDADSDFEVTGNLFEANNVGMSADLPVLPGMVDGNTFTGNLFEDFGLGISASSFDLSALVGDANSFSGGVPEVSAYAVNGGGSQTIEGSDANDVMQVAGASRVEFLGASGADTLTGGANSDVLDGGDGDDTAAGGAGQDSLSGGSGNDVLLGEGDDPLVSLPSYSTDFSEFDIGPITDGENGWEFAGTSDQEVVDLGGAMGHAFRMSSDPTTGAFGGPYSASAPVTAAEPQTTADVDSLRISYDFMAVSNTPDSSRLEVDFGTADGADRNNFLVIEWDAGVGLRVAVNDPSPSGDWNPNDFTAFSGNRTLIEGLDGGGAQWHNLEMVVRFVDGPDNDVIDIYLDGTLVGQTTTFENYRDSLGGTHLDNAEDTITSRLFFRNSASGAPNDGPGGDNQGFYFDNVKITGYDSGAHGDSLDGGVGDDLLSGQLGDDTLSGGTGLDMLYGGEGDDTLTGGSGDDLMIGGVGLDQAVFAGSFADATLSTSSSGDLLVSGIDGNDTLNGVEDLAFADTTVRIVGEDGYATIQAAVDASTAGDTILVKAGSYGEVVTVDKQVTILGAQAGVDGADVGRGTGESSVDGGFLIQANGVTLDGLRIEDGATIAGSKAGVYITGDDATITNMLFERSGGFDGYRGVLTPTSSDQSGLEVTASKFTGWATGVYTDADSDFEVTGNLFEANNVGMSADLPVLPGMVDGNTFTGNLFEDFGLGISASSFDLSALVGDANSFSGGVPEVSAYALNGGGSQTIEGSDANDVMQVAGASRVEFLGASGADTLTGGANNDILNGGEGDDVLVGGSGNDILFAGSGFDSLTGGAGADSFRFTDNEGTQTVIDFDVAEIGEVIGIKIDINGTDITDFADLAGRLSDDGTNVTLDLSNRPGDPGTDVEDYVVLEGVGDTALLDSSDFVFFL